MAASIIGYCLAAGVLAVYAYVTIMDIRTMEIPDRSHLLILAAALADMAVHGGIPFLSRVCGMFILSLPLLAMAKAVPGSIGGGDIKLCGASGFLLGPAGLIQGAAAGFLVAGAFGALLLVSGRARPDSAFPLGPFLCLGFAWAFLWTGPS